MVNVVNDLVTDTNSEMDLVLRNHSAGLQMENGIT